MANHKTSLVLTGDTFSSLQSACEAAGTNLTEVCKQAGVSRSTVERWKHEEPKTIRELRKLFAAVNKLKR